MVANFCSSPSFVLPFFHIFPNFVLRLFQGTKKNQNHCSNRTCKHHVSLDSIRQSERWKKGEKMTWIVRSNYCSYCLDIYLKINILKFDTHGKKRPTNPLSMKRNIFDSHPENWNSFRKYKRMKLFWDNTFSNIHGSLGTPSLQVAKIFLLWNCFLFGAWRSFFLSESESMLRFDSIWSNVLLLFIIFDFMENYCDSFIHFA